MFNAKEVEIDMMRDQLKSNYRKIKLLEEKLEETIVAYQRAQAEVDELRREIQAMKTTISH